jgi:hypothetical protein
MYTFEAKKAPSQVQFHLQKIIDLTVPNFPSELQTDRSQERFNRCLPALLCPWENGRPDVQHCAYVLTKDMSTEGVGVVLTAPFQAGEVLLGFRLPTEAMPEPWFFLGSTQGQRPIGGGFWTLGIKLREFASAGYDAQIAPLFPLAEHLRKPVHMVKPAPVVREMK